MGRLAGNFRLFDVRGADFRSVDLRLVAMLGCEKIAKERTGQSSFERRPVNDPQHPKSCVV